MLQALLARTVGIVQEESRSNADEPGGDGGDARASLYACASCGRTFVSESKATCARCDEPVERVPDERELGIGAR